MPVFHLKKRVKKIVASRGQAPTPPPFCVKVFTNILHNNPDAPAVHRMRCGFASHASCERLRFFSKGKKVKNQKLLCSGKAKAQAAVAVARRIDEAKRRTAEAGAVAPATAAVHPEGAR